MLKFVFLIVIICTGLVATKKYEHISDWTTNLLPEMKFICGENNRDDEVFTGSFTTIPDSYNVISFENCQFNKIEKSFFETLKNVRAFNISDVELEKFDVKALREAKNLKVLLASNNRLTEITSHLFITTMQLEFVDFSNNIIQRIDPMAFESVNHLNTLNLSHNHIDKLELNTFPLSMGGSLLTLDLSHNNLTALNEHIFDTLANLTQLNLSYNPIGNLSIGIFAHLMELQHLSLKRTNISNIGLGTFSHQHKLVSLDLSENNLKQLDFNRFLPIMADLQSIDLHRNQLNELNSFRNEIFPKLNRFDIKNNPFNCTYLQRFMETIKWDTIQLPMDVRSTQTQQEHIHGINCSNGTISSNAIESTTSNETHSDMTIIIMSLITLCVCVIVVILLMIFLGRHRIFTCHQATTTTYNQQQNPALSTPSVNFASTSESRLYDTISYK